MKKLLFIFILTSCFVLGQRIKYDSYYNQFENKNYTIFLTSSKNYNVMIGLPSKDLISNYVYVDVSKKTLVDFISSFKEAQKKFNEWKEISNKERINQISKKMDIDSKRFSYSFLYGDTLYQTNAGKLDFKFIIENEIPYCVFYADGLAWPSNTYFRTSGFELRFKNDSDFDEFFSKLSTEKIQFFLENKTKNENLLN